MIVIYQYCTTILSYYKSLLSNSYQPHPIGQSIILPSLLFSYHLLYKDSIIPSHERLCCSATFTILAQFNPLSLTQ
ncbi:hypothetical protein AYI70_g10967 [Smittium culicis]|uniref:Uncharacterized protein n=1 Tax=Smittium culicis TaxID=133412 RepID=A0A1R1X401_9FUNG|nr:hypothetical protein AYI70_g10967 [Smittium culicis]